MQMRNVKTPRFQARHYEATAETLRTCKPNDTGDRMFQWQQTVSAFIAMFKADNGNFQPDRFRRACGAE
jgi:hypothetical protein